MAFNFLPYFADGWPESQLAEGGVNATDNCGGASGALVMMAYGYPDIAPQTWTDYEYGPTYHGGMTLESLVNFVQTHYPNPPPMAIESPPNVAAAIAAYGAQGFPCIGWFFTDSSANILQYPGPISHFSPVIAFDGNIFSIRNVWRGFINTFNAAQFNAASVGRILVFKRSLEMTNMTQDEFNSFVANCPWFTDIAYRVLALVENSATVVGGGTAKGEVNKLKAALDAIKAAPAASPVVAPTKITGTINGTIS